ncbi:hypothetical protein ACFXJ8_01690 [Nonomuraea sp. NPDC059194]|uniref:hypothetical protein n=1 Tax=Nonomuraea sp. NPDC059194 TaxID=3346764 RepID=UPI00368202FE
MTPPLRFGYIDESIHDKQGLYLLGLVRADPLIEDEARGQLSACVPPGHRPHWHTEGEAVRAELVQVVARLDVEASVYACRFAVPERQEAARARALGWAMLELSPGVDHLIIDRREGKQNQIDRKVLSVFAGRPRRFTYVHAESRSTPLLWVADIVVGAAAAQLAQGEERYLKPLDGRVELSCELTAS